MKLSMPWKAALWCGLVAGTAEGAAPPPSPLPLPLPLPQSQSYAEKAITGTWYGEISSAGNAISQRFLSTRNSDGSYTLEMRSYEKGKIVSRINNAGLWGISNGLYFTVLTEIDGHKVTPRDPANASLDLVREVKGDEFRYQNIQSGSEIRVVRVAPSTLLPN